jgi:hypothetical protein
MVILATLLAALGTQIAGADASGQFVDGNKLYEMCTEKESGPTHYQDHAWCVGYVLGTYDTMKASGLAANLAICVPDEVNAGQLHDVIVKALEEHPEIRHYSGSMLVGAALRASFKCPPQPK